jgi:ATP-binding cassette subfamily F protein 3
MEEKNEIGNKEVIENPKQQKTKVDPYNQAKQIRREQKKKERQIEEIEKQIETIEIEIEQLELCFSNIDPKNFQEIHALSYELKNKKNSLNSLYSQWEILVE